jgi:hypothetical protein
MCLVEVEKTPKLQIACNTPVAEGMVVHTQSEQALAGRQGVLELLDLACVKINKPKPRRLSLIMCRFQSTNVSVTGIHSSAPSRFSDVPGVAAAGRPRLMIFLTVVPQSRPHPFGKRGKAIAVPFLQRLTGERLTGSVALISENSDLVRFRLFDLVQFYPAGIAGKRGILPGHVFDLSGGR